MVYLLNFVDVLGDLKDLVAEKLQDEVVNKVKVEHGLEEALHFVGAFLVEFALFLFLEKEYVELGFH